MIYGRSWADRPGAVSPYERFYDHVRFGKMAGVRERPRHFGLINNTPDRLTQPVRRSTLNHPSPFFLW